MCVTTIRDKRVLTGRWFSSALPAVLRVMTGGDRLAAHLGVDLKRGSKLLLNSCFHLPPVCAQLVFSSEGQIILSDRDKQIHPRS